ncbi:MAG: hypothetical protein PHV21_03235 [Synergistaceae bacterium]|jgi:hypothetical protein|nr:hypothetical protein [Synergistaceae bacterium]MDD3916509.1 hypothetical protein [Synergistaceae bacterium]NLD95930.1 hypothetical protein [Synergistaceae bacterium]HPR90031.1 hypothetical protein [Synergistaceae bacterium]HRV97429.1 hypothetical protein [Aminobacteriaceae bacterium]
MTEERNEHKLIQEVKRLLDSEGLVTARLVESVTRTAQMASTTVPEIQDLFSQWLSLIGGEVARMAASSPEMDIASTANRIGIEESSLLSLLLMLQREGALSIESVRIGKGKGKNSEICSCLMGTEEDA